MEREKIIQPEKAENLSDELIRTIFGSTDNFKQRIKQATKELKENGTEMSECDFARYVIGNGNANELSEKEFAMIKREIKKVIKDADKGDKIKKISKGGRKLSLHIGRGEEIATDEMEKEARIKEENEELTETGFDPEEIRKELK
ncbi:MAG: hypothetical protein UR69_C0002G0187 [Candidatus Moranbacteria bacterium GW2011_GWE2_35_2-]|nr:MAG: hypothetical protein UR69_C0002G0187 [Candidatus Moranbacteria bacterium GW2011_GWE2_35_2-]KKQ06576.1 MAG: hypothetical protein US15_C0008G0008 [Candidatus Moranbacteria bacterium GW2011_GWF1_36_4]KKQ22464.1 MAG: hypothetical protein US37_C0002G0089 [Candidatus Moranbacteria bacterium GW2011_GWF2_37_11]KKQ29533.1 MAG: hypothetical protein US44_C0001G0125 [Candidatus Moranbacteria bacterium GW2011_GWD1_37_17]KKQ30597.1 MAG: hypothetical protein US47_C0002G0187 [Candidatus Moranbacteria b